MARSWTFALDQDETSVCGVSANADVGTSRRAVRCSACGATYFEDEWGSLVLARRIEPSEIRRLVRGWDDGLSIEVRRCRSCSASIAVKRHRSARGESSG
jgi:hypothetical protein